MGPMHKGEASLLRLCTMLNNNKCFFLKKKVTPKGRLLNLAVVRFLVETDTRVVALTAAAVER